MQRFPLLACVALAFVVTAQCFAATLPVESETTTFTATVSEQADLSVPDEISFDVVDVTQDTGGTGLTVAATSIALIDGNTLRIELKADAANFTPPAGAGVTWAASDVSWDTGTWTGGTGIAGTLSSLAYVKVAESGANPTELSSDDVMWTLASKSNLDRAGTYSLATTWRFSSFTP